METAFTGNVGGTNIKLTVIPVTIQDINQGTPVYNEVELSNGPVSGGSNLGHSYAVGNQAHITMMDHNGQGFVDSSGKLSVWNKGLATGAHYAGHLMGLPDTHQSGTGVMDAGPGQNVTSNDLKNVMQTDPPGMGVRNRVINCPHPDC